MSDTGSNYKNLLDCNSELNVNQSIVKWKMKKAKLHNTIITLYELIDIRTELVSEDHTLIYSGHKKEHKHGVDSCSAMSLRGQ